MFQSYRALIGYCNIIYVCLIDSHRKNDSFNRFFEEHGEDTSSYSMELIEEFMDAHAIMFRRYYLLDRMRTDDENMTFFGRFLYRAWQDAGKT
ncbi:MAG: hypothetical protein LIV24_08445 [Eubacterium sp.]|nr:hypothetical protein [Eubacterium sp.]